jgi:enterochelin esterase family protein
MKNMRQTFLTLVAVIVFLSSLPCAQAQFQRGPQVSSPEVKDSKATFRILAPNAQKVQLSGSDIPGAGQGVAMTKGDDGVWSVSMDIAPGYYRYNFNVDGVTVIDPRNPATSESVSNVWSLVSVPGLDWMDTTDIPHGHVSEVTYHSKSLNRFRRMHVYTPPGYEKSQDSYPVLYLLHGAGDSDDSWTTVGRAAFILDQLISAGKAKPMIVAMPAGHAGPFRFPGSGEDEFSKDFTTDLMPYVESHFRTKTDRASRAMAGLSMGGAQTLNVAIPGLDKFAYIGVFSSGVFGIVPNPNAPPRQGPSYEEQHQKVLDDASLKEGLKVFWFATGKDDFLVETSRATVEMFKKHGFNVAYEEGPGAHTWIVWREYLHQFAPMLFQP